VVGVQALKGSPWTTNADETTTTEAVEEILAEMERQKVQLKLEIMLGWLLVKVVAQSKQCNVRLEHAYL
jgi:hypothetical protein